MPGPLTDWVAEVKPLVADDALKLADPGDYQAAIKAVLKDYSRPRPLLAYEEYTGDGSTFDFAEPTNWDEEFSIILEVEYPTGKRPQEFLDQIDWKVVIVMVASVATRFVRLVNHTPTASEKVLVTYTRLHQVADPSTETVPAADREAVITLAASKACLTLAAKHADEVSTAIDADTIDHSNVAREFRAQARQYRLEYERHLGIGKEAHVAAAAAVRDLDVKTPGYPRLFRGPRTR